MNNIQWNELLLKLRKEKEEAGLKCRCDESMCGKCLAGNCADAGCPTHSDIQKKLWKERNLRGSQSKKSE